jgi:hypothetical protein
LNKKKYILFLIILGGSSLHAQNLEKIGSKDFMTIHGGINFNTVNYFANGMPARRDPFTWFASGNLNLSVLDVAIPLNYSYSNLGGKFTQPFNQFNLNPTYKWIKTHIGYSSMTFSNYTLAGHLFFGGGIELTPGKWNFAMMGGRLNKDVQYDAINGNINQIMYKRYGYGFKGGYKNGMNEISLIVFKAKDQINSLVFIPVNSTVKPQDNVVASLGGKTALFQKLTAEGEISASALTANLRDETALANSTKKLYDALIVKNASTQTYLAWKASLGYKLTNLNFALNYEHIDAGYKTLGGYFFNNDLENYTLSGATNFWKKKINLGFNTGIQHNNLDHLKSATTSRVVGSVNISAAVSQKFNLNASYSNFSNFTRKRLQADPFYTPLGDTLNFYNQSQTASLAAMYAFGNNNLKQNINAVFNYNESVNVSGTFTTAGIYGIGAPAGVTMNVYTANLIYCLQFAPVKLSIAGGINTNYTRSIAGNNVFVGPMLNISKTFSKGFGITAGSVYNRQYTTGVLMSNVFNHRLALIYKPKMKTGHAKTGNINMSINGAYMQRLGANTTNKNISEITVFGMVGYTF